MRLVPFKPPPYTRVLADSNPPLIPIRELTLPGVALDWYEAVALTAALAGAVRELQLAQAPAFDAIGLALDGEIGVTSAAVQEGTAAQGVTRVLERLLEAKPCPAELRQVVGRYTADVMPATEALDDLVRDLAFFLRPGRDEMLRQLAQRALVAVEEARTAEEINRLTERARLQEGLAAPFPLAPIVGAAEPLGQIARRLAVPATGAVLVTLVVAFATTKLLNTAEAPPELSPVSMVDDEVTPDAARPTPGVPAASPSPGRPPRATPDSSPGAGQSSPEVGGSTPAVRQGSPPAGQGSPPVGQGSAGVAPSVGQGSSVGGTGLQPCPPWTRPGSTAAVRRVWRGGCPSDGSRGRGAPRGARPAIRRLVPAGDRLRTGRPRVWCRRS